MNSSDLENSLLQICDWQIPNRSSEPHAPQQSDLENTSISKYINNLTQVTNTEVTKSSDTLKKGYTTPDEDNFLPSALLKQSLENALTNSRSKKNNILRDKNDVSI
jgi:hypothetical protein